MINLQASGRPLIQGSGLPFQSLLTKVMNVIHGKNWCYINKGAEYLNRCYKLNTSSTVLIYYPEITITNELEHTHVIRNLFMVIEFYPTYISVKGTRALLNNYEKSVGYQHSHLPTTHSTGRLNNFCLGGVANELNSFVANWENITEENLIYLLTTLKDYLSWESIAGVPHICMEELIFRRVEKSDIKYKIKSIETDTTYGNIITKLVILQKSRTALRNNSNVLIPKEVEKVRKRTEYRLVAGTFNVRHGVDNFCNTDVGEIVETEHICKDKNLIENIELKLNKLAYALR